MHDHYGDPLKLGLSEGRKISEIACPAEILDEMRRSPIIYHVLEFWKEGRCTWEQAMMLCVLKLNEHNRELQKMAYDKISREPFGLVPKPPPVRE